MCALAFKFVWYFEIIFPINCKRYRLLNFYLFILFTIFPYFMVCHLWVGCGYISEDNTFLFYSIKMIDLNL